MKRWKLMGIILSVFVAVAAFFFLNQPTTGTVTDIDGNVYKTVQIGKQFWMAENLRVQNYSNGDSLPLITGNKEWGSLTTGARCVYNNQPENEKSYGAHYNWFAVNDSRGLCPKGWRIPSDTDWQNLTDNLGGWKTAGSKLKRSDNFWVNATNSSGFSAITAGYRMFTGKYLFQNDYAGFWTSTSGNEEFAWIRILSNYDATVTRMFYGKKNGISCRCVKDAP